MLTVGMPVYNGEKYIAAMLESLRRQTFTDYRAIICDDCSTDGTLAICRQFAARDNRFQVYLNEERLGGARNFNRTFALAEDELFMWASQDDLFHPQYMEKCLKKLQDSPQAVLALSEMTFFDDRGKYRPEHGNIGTEGMSVAQRLREVFRRTGWWAIYGVIRAAALRRTGLYRNVYAGDVILIAELLLEGEFAKVDEVLFYYRKYPDCRSAVENQRKIDHTREMGNWPYTAMIRGILDCVRSRNFSSEVREEIFEMLVNTLIRENPQLLHAIIQENLLDSLNLALTCDRMHNLAVDHVRDFLTGPANRQGGYER